MADRIINININDQSPKANTAYVEDGKSTEVYNKEQVNQLIEDIKEGTIGSVSPSQTLAQLNTLEDGNYYGSEEGVYSFGITVPKGWQYRFNKKGSDWTVLTKIEIPMQEVDKEFNPISENAIANNLVTNALQVFVDQKYINNSILASNSTMTWVTGKYLDAKGAVKAFENFSYGDNYIPVVENNKYSFISSGIAIIWYNNNNVVISTSGGLEDQPFKRTFIAPAGATKCRINVANSVKDQFIFEELDGGFKFSFKEDSINISQLQDVNLLISILASNSTMTWVTGKYLDAKGAVKAFENFSYGDNYIPVVENNKYSFISSGIAIIWYNNNNVVISTSGGLEDQPFKRTFIAPAGATKCRINVANSVKDQFIFEEAGGVEIKTLKIKKSQIEDILNEGEDNSIKNLKRGEIQSFDFNSAKINGNVIISGDSTIASYAGGAAIADIIKSTGDITNIAIPGNTILQQLSEWNKLSEPVKSSASYVFVQIGLNDLEPTTTKDIIKTNYDTYINKIKNDCPNAKIILGTMLPCKQRFINLYGEILGLVSYSNWMYLNEYIRTLKSVSAISISHTWLLNDGGDNLDSIFDTGDNIHESTKGRLIIAYSWIMASILS